MSFDMDEKEFLECQEEGESGMERVWAAYEEACKDRDTARQQLRDIAQLIWQYAGIDGAHHKQWVFDQIIRVLAHQDPKVYADLIADYEDGEYGPQTYVWNGGIAP